LKMDDYEKALDKYEVDKAEFAKQQAAPKAEVAQLDNEIFEQINKNPKWWEEPEHAEAHRTMPERTVAGIKALSEQEKQVIASSPVRTMQLDTEFDNFLGHAMARVKNLGKIHLEFARSPDLVKRMNEDWIKSRTDPKFRWATERVIRYMLHSWDKKAGSGVAASKPNGGERQLTRAGRPPVEATGSHSSPADDGSAEAAWKRKDLTTEERGELYRTRKNEEEAKARRARHRRR
jgi:hypothetical protein